mmetsp:Transcript_18194/g.24592  ORF Transcript_18194/g.24592 Transcript_18194/m.24592 type:complete len:332 (-) Transcript_18194:355-1350(-)
MPSLPRRKRKKRMRKKRTNQKPKTKKNKNSVDPGPGYFTKDPTQQPSIMEVLSVTSGVSVTSGQLSKMGPPPFEDASHQSLSAYQKTRGIALGEPDIAEEDEESLAAGSADGTLTTVDETFSVANTTLATASMKLPLAPIDEPTALDSGETHTHASFAGARKRSIPIHGGPEVDDEEEDIHWNLAKAADWGVVGPIMQPAQFSAPPKPNDRQLNKTIRMRGKKPKERLAADLVVPTGKAKRLPAPPIGLSTGHGNHGIVSPKKRRERAAPSPSSSRSFLPKIPLKADDSSVTSGVSHLSRNGASQSRRSKAGGSSISAMSPNARHLLGLPP